ncbi:hypothetical protein LTR78_002955 [Recurvomyces mirabilis]|uniref:Uncharacterized protein n=1 Tax=Recurvomyces mirabilis TaxID=574656 RepID=A0AAE0WTB7_9PEZI|nr:hypothetical protein LTR78_002955 [Recurvomyces mirabilis]KAK5159312.1 hypothetical protein LTS14_002454 [Recurvomyces mirabilis]
MAAKQLSNHYLRLLNRWPVDRLRPADRHFQKLLQTRLEQSKTSPNTDTHEVNAAYLLLDNTFTKQFPLPKAMMNPASAPDMYINLAKELEEAPDRTWWGNFSKRMKNMIRMK